MHIRICCGKHSLSHGNFLYSDYRLVLPSFGCSYYMSHSFYIYTLIDNSYLLSLLYQTHLSPFSAGHACVFGEPPHQEQDYQ
ncbi:hypothetical protein KFK09_029189 [Dendrobium nobile]|uniref:Uncharacterized protein n=1 Tax=Dendrobium nobile TaxID=94219 RepID=A0A8T3A545_DENNO|nr:hypothetical protein KFK09_029189 [Dendrobium nobile]